MGAKRLWSVTYLKNNLEPLACISFCTANDVPRYFKSYYYFHYTNSRYSCQLIPA